MSGIGKSIFSFRSDRDSADTRIERTLLQAAEDRFHMRNRDELVFPLQFLCYPAPQVHAIPLVSSSFVRMFVGSRGMFVGKLAMFESSSGVLLCLFVLAEIVMMGRLMVVMRGGVVVSGGLVVMLTRRMLR
jgi:hypothetical protein